MNARVPHGARWTCHQCADCCRSFDIGPVEPAVVRRLQAVDPASFHPPAADGWLETRRDPSGAEAPFFASRDGACVFLRSDQRCAIHVALGADAKPGMCRVYPFRVAIDPAGAVLTARPTCGGYHASAADGAPFEEHVDEVVALARTQPMVHFHPQRVAVLPDAEVDIATWMACEADLLAALRVAEGEPDDLVVGARELLFECLGVEPVEDDLRRAHMAAGAVYEGLIRLLGAVAAAGPAPGVADSRQRFVVEMIDELKRAQRYVASPASLEPSAAAWANLLLRSAILSKEIHTFGSVAAGLGLWELGLRFARVTGVADDAPAVPMTAAQLSAALTRWERLIAIRAVRQLLAKAAPAMVDLFLYLP